MLPVKLILEILAFSLILISIIVFLVRKNLFSIKYSLIWIFVVIGFLISTMIPNFINDLRIFLGFQTLSNMILSIMIGLLIIITLTLTIIVSGQKESIRLLSQEISLLKEKVK